MAGPTCPRCGGTLCIARRGGSLYLCCNASNRGGGCVWRPVMVGGHARSGEWCAVTTAGGKTTLLAVGPEGTCWETMLKARRPGQLVLVAPLGQGEG
jgi:hypothetical protein